MKKVFLALTKSNKNWSAMLKDLVCREMGEVQTLDPLAHWDGESDLRKLVKIHMREADVVAVVWSESQMRSSLINYELGMADALEKPIHYFTGVELS